jgi:ABC-type Na+ efflux pump permease subunit
MKGRVILGVIALALLALGAGAAVTGVSQIKTRATGEKATARVTGCSLGGTSKSRTVDCTGTWVTGGKLVGGKGHVVVGRVEGASDDDAGRTIAVRLSSDGQKAYTPSLATPIIYLLVGLAFLALGLFLLVGVLRRRPAAAA